MNTFDFCDKLLNLFYDDTTGVTDFDYIEDMGLVELLGVTSDADSHIRTEDISPELYDPEEVPFIAFYIADADRTQNYLVNRSLLRIDIYTSASSAYIAKYIRKRIVDILHDNFDERVTGEGQRSSGINNVYKYRLEFSPLVFT